MKKDILLLLAFLFLFNKVDSQEFVPGYYIINSTAKFAVITPSGDDFIENTNLTNCYGYPNIDYIKVVAGEVVIAYELSSGKVLSFYPNGRQVVFDNINNLTKAPTPVGAGICMLTESIQLLDGSTLEANNYYWAISQDLSKSTIKIQVAEGKVFEVPQSNVLLLGAILKKELKDLQLKQVDN
jgi:hypothetical protein